ncbi:hypothetical protein TNCV_91081 [Trichonephila clavipes]|nr:hypothetical protein TNCV_91081 [Trichonephila clavipes]
MIEEYRPLKSAIKCHATERWTEVLPIILLGLRASLKEDILCTPAELVFWDHYSTARGDMQACLLFLNTEDFCNYFKPGNETPATVELNAAASTPATVGNLIQQLRSAAAIYTFWSQKFIFQLGIVR